VSVGVGVVTRTDSGLASAVNGRCECGSRWEQWVHENSGSVRVGDGGSSRWVKAAGGCKQWVGGWVEAVGGWKQWVGGSSGWVEAVGGSSGWVEGGWKQWVGTHSDVSRSPSWFTSRSNWSSRFFLWARVGGYTAEQRLVEGCTTATSMHAGTWPRTPCHHTVVCGPSANARSVLLGVLEMATNCTTHIHVILSARASTRDAQRRCKCGWLLEHAPCARGRGTAYCSFDVSTSPLPVLALLAILAQRSNKSLNRSSRSAWDTSRASDGGGPGPGRQPGATVRDHTPTLPRS
jgi:hypothetical protein